MGYKCALPFIGEVMNWVGGGFVPIIIYQAFTEAVLNPLELTTHTNLNIMTHLSENIVVQEP